MPWFIQQGTCIGAGAGKEESLGTDYDEEDDGKNIVKCEQCGKPFEKHNRSDRCPECRKKSPKKKATGEGDTDWTTPEERERDSAIRQANLINDAAKAKEEGLSYGQLQAQRLMSTMRSERLEKSEMAEIRITQKREAARASMSKRRKAEKMKKEEARAIAPTACQPAPPVDVWPDMPVEVSSMLKCGCEELTGTIEKMQDVLDKLIAEREELTREINEKINTTQAHIDILMNERGVIKNYLEGKEWS